MTSSTANELTQFGSKLRRLRAHNNMTLSAVAAQLGYTTHSYISEIELGNKLPTVIFVIKVARLFDVSTDELLKDELELSLPSIEGK